MNGVDENFFTWTKGSVGTLRYDGKFSLRKQKGNIQASIALKHSLNLETTSLYSGFVRKYDESSIT